MKINNPSETKAPTMLPANIPARFEGFCEYEAGLMEPVSEGLFVVVCLVVTVNWLLVIDVTEVENVLKELAPPDQVAFNCKNGFARPGLLERKALFKESLGHPSLQGFREQQPQNGGFDVWHV